MNKNSQAKEPSFNLIKKDGDFEIRKYPALIFAETKKIGTRKEAMNSGFKTLASYIFTKHQIKEGDEMKMEKIPMTIPVLAFAENFEINETSIIDGSNSWIIRFVMPEGKELSWFPKSQTPEIQIFQEESKQFLCLKFHGFPTNKEIIEKISEIKDFSQKHSIKIKDPKKVILAFYNPPWDIPFLKRNEIMIEIDSE